MSTTKSRITFEDDWNCAKYALNQSLGGYDCENACKLNDKISNNNMVHNQKHKNSKFCLNSVTVSNYDHYMAKKQVFGLLDDDELLKSEMNRN